MQGEKKGGTKTYYIEKISTLQTKLSSEAVRKQQGYRTAPI